MSPLESRDIFKRLQISAGFQNLSVDNCHLCGLNPDYKKPRYVCSHCVQCMANLNQKDKQKIYIHMIELKDKERANTLSKCFQVFKEESPLKQIRKSLKMTQAVFAKKIGVRRDQIAQIEAGIRACNDSIEHKARKLLQG